MAGLIRPLIAEKVETLHSRNKGISSAKDDIVTWLQDFLDCTHERGYCTKLFERLAPSPSLGKAEQDGYQGIPASMADSGRRSICAGSEYARDALCNRGARHASGLLTENHRRLDASMRIASAEMAETAMLEASASVRQAAPCEERKWCKTRRSMNMPSCSGEAQTDAESSAKETSSPVKKAVYDNDCQSKNAEVDSAKITQSQRHRAKRSRVAESHNLCEKKRRNRINERLRTLQELIPNSSKTDMASILDKAIEYLKALQLQLQTMSSTSSMKFSMMGFPLGMQHIQMAHSMGLGFALNHTGMGMGLMELQHGMDGSHFQAPSTAFPFLNFAYQRTAPAPTQPYLASHELWPLQQLIPQAYHQTYVEPQAVMGTEQGDDLSTPRSLSKAG